MAFAAAGYQTGTKFIQHKQETEGKIRRRVEAPVTREIERQKEGSSVNGKHRLIRTVRRPPKLRKLDAEHLQPPTQEIALTKDAGWEGLGCDDTESYLIEKVLSGPLPSVIYEETINDVRHLTSDEILSAPMRFGSRPSGKHFSSESFTVSLFIFKSRL